MFQNKPLPQVFGNKLNPDPSAQVEIDSNGVRGFLGARMTSAQRLAIPAPAEGLEVFDTDAKTIYIFNGTVWISATGISGPSPVVDDSIVRYDGITGGLVQGSNIILNDSDEISGVTRLDVDNLRLDGNVISSTDLDGNITLTPNGTGKVIVSSDFQVLGTTTSVDSTVLEVVDANVTTNKGGNQASADAQGGGITIEMSDATDAALSYDSSLTSKFKIGEIGTQSEIVTVGDTQTVVNKRLSNTATVPANLSFNQQSTTTFTKPWSTMTNAERDAIAAPAQGYVIYNTDGNELQIFDGVDWISYNIGVFFMIENGYKRDFVASNLGTTFETIKTITGGTLKAFDIVNNSGNDLLLRVTATGDQMLIARGATLHIGYRGVVGDIVQIATVSGTANTGNLYINFLGI